MTAGVHVCFGTGTRGVGVLVRGRPGHGSVCCLVDLLNQQVPASSWLLKMKTCVGGNNLYDDLSTVSSALSLASVMRTKSSPHLSALMFLSFHCGSIISVHGNTRGSFVTKKQNVSDS